MTLQQRIDDGILAVLTYLEEEQQPDGSFIDNFGHKNTFYSALIVLCLEHCRHDRADTIKQKACGYLRTNQEASGIWRYNDSLPPDMDDTFVTMRALYSVDQTFLDTEKLAALVKLLIDQETAAGGPYQTWILKDRDEQWHDVDIVVNSNIAAFLKSIGVQNVVLQKYLNSCITEKSMHSKYYHSEIVILYFLSQTCDIKNTTLLKKEWGSVLDTALATTALLRLHENPQSVLSALSYIIDATASQTYHSQPLFIESIKNNIATYCSCPAFVAAACLETLVTYGLHTQKEAPPDIQENSETAFVATVQQACIESIPTIFTEDFETCLHALNTKDPAHEIILLAYHFAKNLAMPGILSDQTVIDCSVANTFGWIGYTLYDKLSDSEPVVALQSLAHVCVQYAQKLFYDLTPTQYHAVPQRIFTEIVTANAWERQHCPVELLEEEIVFPTNLPEYADMTVLAQKSLGHALGPMALCYKCGYESEAHIIQTFFTHYLIAKQLHDDAHDWQDDLLQGRLNSVSAGLVQCSNLTTISELREYFWQYHIDTVSTLIYSHIQKARSAFAQLTVLSSTCFLEALLVPLEQSAMQAVRERDQSQQLLEALAR